MLELIQKIETYTEAGIILEHMDLFDEVGEMSCDNCKHYISKRSPDGRFLQIGCKELGLNYNSEDFFCSKFKKED